MPTTDLMTVLPIDQASFLPQWSQEYSRQAGGTPRVADLGPELWLAKLTCSVASYSEAAESEAFVHALDGAIGTFYVWNPRAQYPRADPNGTILGAASVTIYELGLDNKSIRLAGLPVGYQLKRRDFFSFDTGSAPNVHRCLHQFVAPATADSNGRIALTEVRPHIRAGASTGLSVSLKRPAAEMFILPGSYDSHTTKSPLSAMTLTALQVP
jgi:hypothetical protein